MCKKILLGLVVIAFLAIPVQANLLMQGYDMGATNFLAVQKNAVATGGNVLTLQQNQYAGNALQQQDSILVQGGTAVSSGHYGSGAGVLQVAGAEGCQELMTGRTTVAGQDASIGMMQALGAEKNAGATAGQGVISGSAQMAPGTGNASVIGAVQTGAVNAGQCSDAVSVQTVCANSGQAAVNICPPAPPCPPVPFPPQCDP